MYKIYSKFNSRRLRERERESKNTHSNFLLKTLFSLLISVAFFFLAHTSVSAASYYVANAGNDSCDGTSQTIGSSGSCAWKTIAKVNGSSFSPGDSIYFNKGDTWREQLTIPSSGSNGNPITFGAYGSGANPVIDGSTTVTGWSVYSGSIYVANVGTSVARVFADNAFVNPAHYPDSGYSTITSNSADKVSLTSTSFSPPSADLVGASLFIRTVPWSIENKTVSAYDSGTHTISWTGNTSVSVSANYGFYLTNKLWMLDQAGGWYYDSSAGKLYVWLSDSSNPGAHSISVSTSSSVGIVASSKNYFTIQDITIQNTGSDGVQLNTTTNVTLQRLNVSLAGRYGIYAAGSSSDNLVFDSNVVSKALTVGIELQGLSGSSVTISNNNISDTGNFGLPVGSVAGIDVSSNNVHVQGNTVSNSNYNGISVGWVGGGSYNNNIVQNNVISESCLILDDCGGFYISGISGLAQSGNQVLSNVITDSIGNFSGTAYTYTQAKGIFLDDYSNNTTVSNNTISNTDKGINLHNTYSNTVTNNTIYKSRLNGLFIKEDSKSSLGYVQNNIITGNIFLNTSSLYPSAEFDGIFGSVNFGSYNSNTYLSTYYGNPISQLVTATSTDYSLAQWRTTSGQDAQSSDIGSFFSASKVDAYLGSNLVTNSTFDSNISSWTTFSTDNSSSVNWVPSCGLDGGCLHASTNISDSAVTSNHFSIQAGTTYEVSFSIISNTPVSGYAAVWRNSPPYTIYATRNFTTSNTRQDFSFTFTSPASLIASVNFDTNVADYYIDNISMRPVTAHDTSNDSVLETNSTSNSSTVSLGGSKYCDVNNNTVSGSFVLAPFSSKVLLNCFNNSDFVCNNHETHDSAPLDCTGTSNEGAYAGMDAPLQMGTDKPDIASNIRLYSQGKFRNIVAPSGTTADLSITPQSGFGGSDYSPWMDLSISTWSNTGVRHKNWTESSSTIGSASTLHAVGDLTPYKFYYVSVDSILGNNIAGTLGTLCIRGVCQANSQGKISFIYSGGYSTHTFDITQGVSNTSPTPPWTQTDWSGGSGQTNWSDSTMFSSSANVTTSTPNQITLSSAEKFSNTTFDTDLTNWSGIQNYTLNDAYTTNKSAGTINGTSAEPTGGTRTVTDTGSKISIASSALTFATGETINDGLWYSSLDRAAGKILFQKVIPSDTNGVINVGWDTNASGAVNDRLVFAAAGVLQIVPNGGTAIPVGTYTATSYQVAGVMRSTGFYWYIKGGAFTNWTLLYITSSGTAAEIPSLNVGSTTSIFTADDIRVPTATWLPTPLAYDTFTTNGSTSTETVGPDGQTTPSLSWTGSTWTNSGGTVSNTPTLGSELLANTGAESGFTSGLANSWNKFGTTPTVSDETTIVHAGSNSQKVVGTTIDTVGQNVAHTLGTWYIASAWIYVSAGSANLIGAWDGTRIAYGQSSSTSAASWAQKVITGRSINVANNDGPAVTITQTGTTLYVDDISMKALTLSSLFRSVSASSANVIADANATFTAGTQAGLVLNLDSTSSPANFVIAYLDGRGNVKLDKSVAGVYTNVQSTAVTYSAGATLRVIKDGTSYSVYYNNAQVGTTQTISDAGIVNNTLHGLFSTYSGNTLDNFTLWPRGTGGEYNATIPAEDLTATEDATHTRGSSTGAAKVIAAGNDNNFYQNVNVGDTNTYNMIAYVYTDGSAVTSSDAQLIANGTLVTTTYTADSGGWYKLTGTATGVASSVGYGVQVKAGKTVWVDDMSLKPQSATGTLTSSIFDGGAGVSWGNLTYNVSTPTNTSASVKVITSSTPTISTSFSSCSAISSGASISSGGCNSGEYAQYQVTLSSTDLSQTPTFTGITINFTEPPLAPTSLTQYQSDGVTTIPLGGYIAGTSIVLGLSMSSSNLTDSLTPQIEIEPIGNPFTNNVTNTGSPVAYSGTPVNGIVTVTGLTPGNTYHWQARVSNSVGQGSWVSMGGSPDLGIYFTSPGVPGCNNAPPRGLDPWLYQASAGSNSSISLKFTNWQSPIDHFALEYGTSPNNYQYGADNIGGNGTNQYIVNSLNPNTIYYFRVRAGNGCATGSWSNEISAKTLGLYTTNNLNIVSSTLTPVTTPTQPETTTSSNSCQTYTVKNGDTLWKIASTELGNGSKFKDIATENENIYPSLKTSNNVSVGWKLNLNCSQANNQSATNNTTSGYEVKVKVVDTDKRPVVGAKVTLHSVPQNAVTDKNGVADFKNVEAGQHQVLIAYSGYSGEQLINLTGDVKEFDLNITVQKQNVLLSPQVVAIVGIMAIVITILIVLLIRAKRKFKKV